MSKTTRHPAYRRHDLWKDGILGKGAPHGRSYKAARRQEKQQLQRDLRGG